MSFQLVVIPGLNLYPDTVSRAGDDLNGGLDILHGVVGQQLIASQQLGHDGLLLHQGEALADAVAGAGRKGNIRVGMALHLSAAKFVTVGLGHSAYVLVLESSQISLESNRLESHIDRDDSNQILA